jgi:hypothetical protein
MNTANPTILKPVNEGVGDHGSDISLELVIGVLTTFIDLRCFFSSTRFASARFLTVLPLQQSPRIRFQTVIS